MKVLIGILLLIGTGPFATLLEGTLQSSLTLAKDPLNPNAPDLRHWQALSFDYTAIAGTGFFFSTDAGYTNRFDHTSRSAVDIRLLEAGWENEEGTRKLRVGRLGRFGAQTYETYDGAAIDQSLPNRLSVSLSGGRAAPSLLNKNPFILEPKDSTAYLWSAEVRSHTLDYLFIKGGYEGRVNQQQEREDLLRFAVASALPKAIELSLLVDGELQEKTLRRAGGIASMPLPVSLNTTLSLFREAPRYDSTFFLESLLLKERLTGEAEIDWSPVKELSAGLSYGLMRFNDKGLSQSLEARVQYRIALFQLRQDWGIDFPATTLKTALTPFSNSWLSTQISGGFLHYSVNGIGQRKRDAYLGTLGLTWLPHRFVSAHIEGQYVENHYFNQDIRLVAGTTLSFSQFSKPW